MSGRISLARGMLFLGLALMLCLCLAGIPGADDAVCAPPASARESAALYWLLIPLPALLAASAPWSALRVPQLGRSPILGLCRWDVGPGLFSDWFFCLIVYILRALYGLDGMKPTAPFSLPQLRNS